MSLLSDYSISQALATGHLTLDPFVPQNVGPASIDVTLDNRFLVPHPSITVLDTADIPDGHMQPLHGLSDRVVVAPGAFVLGSTREIVTLSSSLAARYEGRSSVGRLGVTSHVTAGFIDPGFSGHITLEIVNHAPWSVVLHAGMRIGQLALFRTTTPVVHAYGERGSYQGQRGPQESRLRLDTPPRKLH